MLRFSLSSTASLLQQSTFLRLPCSPALRTASVRLSSSWSSTAPPAVCSSGAPGAAFRSATELCMPLSAASYSQVPTSFPLDADEATGEGAGESDVDAAAEEPQIRRTLPRARNEERVVTPRIPVRFLTSSEDPAVLEREVTHLYVPCRLEKFISDSIGLSRGEIIAAWAANRIRVEPAARHAAKGWYTGKFLSDYLIFEGDTVFFDGEPLIPRRPEYFPKCYATYKPRGFVLERISLRDRQNLEHEEGKLRQLQLDPTLHPELHKMQVTHHQRMFKFLLSLPIGVKPIGRLDKDSEGLMLLTDCGDLITAVTTPGAVQKDYVCTFPVRKSTNAGHTCDENDIRLKGLLEGQYLNDGFAQVVAARAARVIQQPSELPVDPSTQSATARKAQRRGKGGKNPPPTWELTVTLNSGRNRIVRRMLGSVGLQHLLRLNRTRIGPLHSCAPQDLPERKEGEPEAYGLSLLRSGSTRQLGRTEVQALWDAAGGRVSIREAQASALMTFATRMRKINHTQHLLEEWLREHVVQV
mmetsp:Transcript_4600/g.14068  ORF Transcript_4600/g.14068 Transcript_4600/m.14068 type:complete len:527 (-) Transcript_4600:10-1590(-)